MRSLILAVISLIAVMGIIVPAAAQQYIPIDLSQYCNARLQNLEGAAEQFPEGTVEFESVPFVIPSGGDNTWTAGKGSGSNPRILDIQIKAFGVRRVHTLINTAWGSKGPPLASIEFIGSGGASHKVLLRGDSDIRDYLWNDFTNTINGTTTIRACYFGDAKKLKRVRLDKQEFTLPEAFAGETLTNIRFSDWGGAGIQRIMVSGLTLEKLPQKAGKGEQPQPTAASEAKTDINANSSVDANPPTVAPAPPKAGRSWSAVYVILAVTIIAILAYAIVRVYRRYISRNAEQKPVTTTKGPPPLKPRLR